MVPISTESSNVSEDQLPLRPFEPLDYRNRTSNIVDETVDPISLRLQVSLFLYPSSHTDILNENCPFVHL